VAILSGDTGTCKSLVATKLATAMVKGGRWLGREVERGPVIYLDAELTQRLAVDRLRGLGIRSADAELCYLNRPGIDLGTPADVDALRALASKVKPTLLVVDTVMACAAGIDVNSNSEVVAFYARVLRPLAVELDVAVLLLHHERKGSQGRGRDAKQAVLGAMEWVGQADRQYALEVGSPLYERELDADGGKHETFRVRLRTPKDRESGDRTKVERIAVESLRRADGALLWLTVELEADQQTPAPEAGEQLDRDRERAEQIAAFVKDHGEAKTAELAAELDVNPRGGSFKRPLAVALGKLGVERSRRGCYRVKVQPPGPSREGDAS
jgi:hypothetical protein